MLTFEQINKLLTKLKNEFDRYVDGLDPGFGVDINLNNIQGEIERYVNKSKTLSKKEKENLIASINEFQKENHVGEDEGDGEYTHMIFFYSKFNIYIKFEGRYYSYNGTTLERWYLVEPKMVTIKTYVEV